VATYQCLVAVLEGDKGRNGFSAAMYKGMMDDFLPVLKTHFGKEEGNGEGLEGLDKTSQIPVFWTNDDVTYGDGGVRLSRSLDKGSKGTRWWVGRKKAE
jgi:hypothetical protein